jgi:putative transposase
MPRLPRIQIAGGIYHVNTVGNRRELVFSCDADYEFFLVLLGRVVRRFGWRVYAYCLMPDHYHLLLMTPKPNIAAGMQMLNGGYAQAFNARYGLEHHVFGERYHSELVERDEHLLETARYIAMNPVRAGLCLEPSEWKWSSHRALTGRERPLPWLAARELLALFGGGHESYRRLGDFVAEAPPRSPRAPRTHPRTRRSRVSGRPRGRPP